MEGFPSKGIHWKKNLAATSAFREPKWSHHGVAIERGGGISLFARGRGQSYVTWVPSQTQEPIIPLVLFR